MSVGVHELCWNELWAVVSKPHALLAAELRESPCRQPQAFAELATHRKNFQITMELLQSLGGQSVPLASLSSMQSVVQHSAGDG